jgi:hypothetical protein
VAVGAFGAVASRLIVTETELVPPPLVAEHVKVVPAVSDVTVAGSHPVVLETVDSGSVTVHVTLTSLTYQPLLPSVPLTFGVITGAVPSLSKTNVRGALAALLPALSYAFANHVWLPEAVGV